MRTTDGFAEIGGSRFRYRDDGEGPPLLLIHGVGSRLEAWDGVVARLRSAFRTLCFDLKGHGESAKPPGPYSAEGFAADAVGILDHLGIARAHVVGFSLGGLVAQAFALAYPARLDRLVLLSTVAGRTPEEAARVRERLDIVASGIPGAHFESSLARWFTDEFRAANPALLAEYAAQNQANDPAAYAAAYRVLALTDLAEDLVRIKAPTLIATGEGDQGSNPRMARLMHERIAGSRLVILPRLRHSILIEAPDRVATLLAEFLGGGASQATPGA
jgi:pimeloyl-ACP methyl ester carboxylesterase